MDGVFARVRRDAIDLNEEEQARAGDVYREIKVATLFRCVSGRERSALAPGALVDTVAETWYRARRTSAQAFGPHVFAEAIRHGVDACAEVVILGDGAAWIWNLAQEYFPGATEIVDVWHAQQHIWDAVHAVYASDNPIGKLWAEKSCQLLLLGQVDVVIERLHALALVSLLPGDHARTPATEAAYFRSHAHRMRYSAFRSRGLLIGSGPAEAGCKSVVSTRFKRSGMRWSLPGIDLLLPIRTAVLNHTFDTWWLSHQQTIVAS